MGRATEVPHERRAFQPPDVPHAVVPQIVLLVEREVERLQAAVGLQVAHHFLDIALAVGRQDVVHYLVYVLHLVLVERTDGNPRPRLPMFAERDRALLRRLFDKRQVFIEVLVIETSLANILNFGVNIIVCIDLALERNQICAKTYFSERPPFITQLITPAG